LVHAAAERVAEHQEVQRRGHERLGQRLPGDAEEPPHLLGEQRSESDRVHGRTTFAAPASPPPVSCRKTSSSDGLSISTSRRGGSKAASRASSAAGESAPT